MKSKILSLLFLFLFLPVLAMAQVPGNAGYIYRSPSTIGPDLTLLTGVIKCSGGTCCFQGTGGSNNEEDCIDLESVANGIIYNSTSGVTGRDFDSDLFVGLRAGDGSRTLPAAGTNHKVCAYSDDTTNNSDWMCMSQNQTDGVIQVGSGNLVFITAGSNLFFKDDTSNLISLAGQESDGSALFKILANGDLKQFVIAPSSLGGGNQVVITRNNLSGADFDHDAQNDPTVFKHSNNSPDQSNSEYGAESHNRSNYNINSGFGGIKLGVDAQPARGTLTLTGQPSNNETWVVNSTTITAKTSGAGTDEFDIGGSVGVTITNIVATINADSESSNAHAWDGTGDTVVVEWLSKGTAGNAITFTEALSNATIDGSGTLGGTHAGVAAAVLLDITEHGNIVSDATEVPNVTSCGTSPTIVGGPMAGKVTIGSTASSTCTITFDTAFAVAPACVFTNGTVDVPVFGTTSTTAMTLTDGAADFSSDVIMYICVGF